MPMKFINKILFIIFTIFISNSLFSQENPFRNTNGHYLSPGIQASMPMAVRPIIGGEISYFYYFEKNPIYTGAFINTSYDFKLESVKSIAGGEFGFAFIGLDVGLIINSKKSSNRIGFIIKPQFNLPLTLSGFGNEDHLCYPFLSLFYGYNFVDRKYQYSEIGFMVKFPIKIH